MQSLETIIDSTAPKVLNLCRVDRDGQVAWQASVPTEASAWRIREAATPSEAIRLILGAPAALPPPPY